MGDTGSCDSTSDHDYIGSLWQVSSGTVTEEEGRGFAVPEGSGGFGSWQRGGLSLGLDGGFGEGHC